VAALASSFCYEERGGTPGPAPWYPSERLRRRFRRLEGLHLRLVAAESDADLPSTRKPDAGFMAVAHGWAAGGDLGDVLDGEEITAGDFVRTAKQLIDLLRQLGMLAPKPATASAARAAAEAVHRDLVAASSINEADLGAGDAEGDGGGRDGGAGHDAGGSQEAGGVGEAGAGGGGAGGADAELPAPP
jgi:ATP-dependent RNA helicase HelY